MWPAAAHSADAPAYPNLPLRFVVPFPPSGANGIIGMDLTSKSPPRFVSRFATALHRALQSSDVKQRLASQGLDTAVSTPEELRKMLVADMAKWTKVVREAGIQPE